jgi:hypothetical protein
MSRDVTPDMPLNFTTMMHRSSNIFKRDLIKMMLKHEQV